MLKRKRNGLIRRIPVVHDVPSNIQFNNMVTKCNWFSLGQQLGIDHSDLIKIGNKYSGIAYINLIVLAKFLSEFNGSDAAKLFVVSKATSRLQCKNSFALTNDQEREIEKGMEL